MSAPVRARGQDRQATRVFDAPASAMPRDSRFDATPASARAGAARETVDVRSRDGDNACAWFDASQSAERSGDCVSRSASQCAGSQRV